MLWADRDAGERARVVCCREGVLLGRWRLVRPEYLGSRRPARCCLVVLAEVPRERLAQRSTASDAPRSCWPALPSSLPRGRSATRSRSTASCRCRPEAARCCSPAPTCPRMATRSRLGARSSPAIPELFEPRCRRAAAARADPRPAGRTALPGLESDEALARMGRDQLWNDVTEEPLDYAGFVATKVWRDLVARAARRDAQARSGRPCTGRSSPSACSAWSPWRGSAAGRRCCSPRSSSRSPRSAPCWSPRRAASW